MKAKVTKSSGFKIFKEGRTVTHPMGTVLEGYEAQKAVETRAASQIMAPKAKKKKDND